MKRLLILGMAVCFALPLVAQIKKKTLAVDNVTISPSVKTLVAGNAIQSACLERIRENLDATLINTLANTRKYTLVERTDKLQNLFDEIEISETGLVSQRAVEFGKLMGAQYLLLSQISSFSLADTVAELNGVKHGRLACNVTVLTRVVDVETGEIHTTSNVTTSKYTLVDMRFQTSDTFAHFDPLIPEVTNDIAQQCTQSLIAYAYPAKVIDVDGNIVTINRGEGTFKVGDVVQIMKAGRKVVDPDTGETYEIPGRKCGTARIVYVDKNIAQAEAPQASEVQIGARVTK